MDEASYARIFPCSLECVHGGEEDPVFISEMKSSQRGPSRRREESDEYLFSNLLSHIPMKECMHRQMVSWPAEH